VGAAVGATGSMAAQNASAQNASAQNASLKTERAAG
jgi:hypothetical protein